MSAARRGVARVVAVVTVLALPSVASAQSSGSDDPAPVTVPETFTAPTPQQVARSIQVWDPSGSVATIETRSTEGDEVVVRLSSDILFAFGRAELPPAAPAEIGDLVAEVPQGAAVAVTGHTDDIGSDAANQSLSEARARAVADAITEARPDLVLTVTGRGESDPVAANDEPEGRQLNRRVEIRFAG